eukprot:452065-Amorphochlora_amoeboformis.AAC.1
MSTCLSRRAPVLVVGTLTAILLHFFGPEGRLRIGHWGGGDGELEDPKLVLKRVSSAGMIADVFKDRTIEGQFGPDRRGRLFWRVSFRREGNRGSGEEIERRDRKKRSKEEIQRRD